MTGQLELKASGKCDGCPCMDPTVCTFMDGDVPLLVSAACKNSAVCDMLERRILRDKALTVPMRRADLLYMLNIKNLAAYLEEELGDGVPTDWLAWLNERADV